MDLVFDKKSKIYLVAIVAAMVGVIASASSSFFYTAVQDQSKFFGERLRALEAASSVSNSVLNSRIDAMDAELGRVLQAQSGIEMQIELLMRMNELDNYDSGSITVDCSDENVSCINQ